MDAELTALNDALPHLDWLEIKERRAGGAIILTPLAAAPEPVNLRRLKAAVKDRWGVVPLLDMLTETALRTGCLNAFTPLGSRENIDPAVLFERLLLLIYAYGTNTGIRAVAAGDHPHSEDDLRYIRCRYVTIQACRDAARAIANATFAARHAWLWGQGTTAVASDSTHFSAFDQNIFTEWHSRYRRAKRGVLIYWTVDTAGAMAIHSQLLQCSASEVHAMVEGAMRHGTDMSVESPGSSGSRSTTTKPTKPAPAYRDHWAAGPSASSQTPAPPQPSTASTAPGASRGTNGEADVNVPHPPVPQRVTRRTSD
jgi:Tn3 transposase DDE domain